MKNIYLIPEISICLVDEQDLITTSIGDGVVGASNDKFNVVDVDNL